MSIQIGIIVIVFLTGCSSMLTPSKMSSNSEVFMKQTKFIMRELSIKIRDSVKEKSLPILKDMALSDYAQFSPDETWVSQPDSAIVFLSPKILLQSKFYSIIYEGKDTLRSDRIRARAVILHEMVHFLHTDFTKTANGTKWSDYVKYVTSPREKESFAVEGYYFLYYYNRKKLKEIIKSNDNIELKKKKIINVYHQVFFPPRYPPIYPM